MTICAEPSHFLDQIQSKIWKHPASLSPYPVCGHVNSSVAAEPFQALDMGPMSYLLDQIKIGCKFIIRVFGSVHLLRVFSIFLAL